MTDILWSQIFLSIAFITCVGTALSAVLVLAEKKILNYGACSIDINEGQKKLEVQGGSSLLSTLADNEIFIPSACGGKATCAYCKVRVLSGAGMISPIELPSLTEEDLKNNVRLSCQVKIREDLTISIPEELFSVKRFSVKVIHKRPLTRDIIQLKLELIKPEKIEFKAGQYIQIESREYKGRENVNRAYSLSSVPSNKNSIELIIRKVPDGICTTWIFDILKEGEEVNLSGPYGQFHLSEADSPIIFIAGGSGMAPIWSMIRDMKERGIQREAKYFFGSLTRDDLFFMDELKSIEKEMPNFKFIPALSNEPEDSDWTGDRGLITDVVKKHVPDMTGYEAYLCGSPGMINACVNCLTEGGILEENIFYDKFA